MVRGLKKYCLSVIVLVVWFVSSLIFADYIRTFTWDKKLETIIKGSMLGGGAGKLPTVVSPEVYRTRFCHAMDRYFLLSPDRWTGLGLGVDP